LDVDQARLLGTEPSTVMSAGSDSGAHAIALRASPRRLTSPAGEGLGLGTTSGVEVRFAGLALASFTVVAGATGTVDVVWFADGVGAGSQAVNTIASAKATALDTAD